jgi:uncharacterized membrane protein
MSLGKLAGLYGICTAVFFALDFAWLSVATGRFYKPMLGSLLAEQPKLGVAAAFYLLYVVGIIALAVLPGLGQGSVVGALWRGALLGLLAYATYDLTNLSTIAGWPWQISAIDLAWGTSVTAAVSVAGYYAGQWLGLAG